MFLPFFGMRSLLNDVSKIINSKNVDEIFLVSDDRECYRLEAIKSATEYLISQKGVDAKKILYFNNQKDWMQDFLSYLQRDFEQKHVFVAARFSWEAEKVMDHLADSGFLYCNVCDNLELKNFFS